MQTMAKMRIGSHIVKLHPNTQNETNENEENNNKKKQTENKNNKYGQIC